VAQQPAGKLSEKQLTQQPTMTLWHASYDLRLTAAGLPMTGAAVVAKSVRLAVEAGMSGLGLDTSG
jgi:hypothetical protein